MEPNEPDERVKGMYLSTPLDGVPVAAGRERLRAADVPLIESLVAAGFDAFYREARPSIARALALSIGDSDLAAEATDEAMTRAYERWTSVSKLDRPEAWVYRVASNWALSIFRRRRLSLHRLYDPSVADPATMTDPAVHNAVAALDIKHRSVVVCRHLLGWSVAETAVALGINEGTVKSRLSRATATLRTQLDAHAPEENS
jgi:RNA polymerase sigma factor (sigma-70 family)